jgi:type IV pilus assembly protein PilY1
MMRIDLRAMALGAMPVVLAASAPGVHAQLVISDTLTGASSSYNWQALNGACLTAGNNTGTIPACSNLAYYSGKVLVGGVSGRLPDPVGQGALRLTNGDTQYGGSNGDNQTGAVVSNFTFPSNQGLQVTFTTVTYGGDGNNGTGADGISFFLADGSQPATVGALGGSLGYSCSNVNGTYDGVIGGYIGVGIDEYGNFGNPSDNTSSGPGFQAGRVGLRGAGNTAWSWLNAHYPSYYPPNPSDTGKANSVHNTCASGYLYNYSGATITDANGNRIANQAQTTQKLAFNYPLIAYSNLPSGVSISNQEGINMPTRGAAVPITYNLQITQNGLLSLSYSVNGGATQTVISNQSISASNGPVPANFRFGFSAGTGGSNNVHEITCFKAAPVDQAQGSAGTNVQQSARVQAGSQVYLAYYHPTNWWGDLTAQSLVYTANTDTVSISPTANWDASCVLTGGACAATGGSNAAQGSSSRSILSWNGSTGIPFQWSNLSSAQQSALTAGDASPSSARLQFLRGDRSNELTSSGTGSFRARTGVLGDIVDSSPTWVGAPEAPYSNPWSDLLYPTASAPEGSYSSFVSAQAGRMNVVYVGANDGMLHGFRAGTSSSTAANDGLEVLAYVPAAALSTIHSTTPGLDYSSPQYSHNFYVDATPGTGDLYYGGAWHTWLVGGTGAGGNAAGAVGSKTAAAVGSVFVLDITNPSNFSESNAASLVKGEWSSSSISCLNFANCNNALGSSVGTPQVRRLHNGQWAVLFGNGLNSASGTAGLFIMLVDPSSGAATFRYIDTGYGASRDPAGGGAKNGIAYVTPADLDGDHITDFVYAGDVFGNVWRFDLTSNSASNWTVGAAPMFSTPGGQPITTKVAVASVPGVGGPAPLNGVLVGFGTGQQLPQTLTSAAHYASGTQWLYGLWDWNMAAWNAKAGAAAQFASLAAPQTVSASSLLTQSILSTTAGSGTISGYRTVSKGVVCWTGSTSCASGNNQYGWKLSLPGGQEQVIYSPVIAYGMFIVNTTIPAASQALTCSTQPASGYTMAVGMGSGGAANSSFFGDPNNNFVTINGQIVSGIGLSATGTPSIVTAQQKPYLVQQTVGGTGVATQINPGANGTGARLNWIKLR